MKPGEFARILVVHDNRAIHDDFRKILLADPDADGALQDLEAAIIGDVTQRREASRAFRVDSAHQGPEALALVQRSVEDRRPYSVAFVDMRMPPG